MIIVCGLRAAADLVVRHNVGAAIGILGPETTHPEFPSLSEKQRLRLSFNDVNAPADGMVTATEADAERLIAFIQQWDRQAPLLVHCWAGISRSTATAFAALCILRPHADEMVLAQELREASASATPNRLITAKIDEALGRGGRMLRAVESIGRGSDAFDNSGFVLRI